MLDWDLVEDYTENARGIAFDTCHKIYVLMDTYQVALMRQYKYEFVISNEEQTPREMLATLKEWFEKSCPLRFVQAVETNHEDEEGDRFTTLIEQGATDKEDCEDCGQSDCAGACYDFDEDEDEE